MPIIQGSTPTIRIVISENEVSYEAVSKIFLTVSQKDEVKTELNTTFVKSPGSGQLPINEVNGTLVCERKLTQAESLALKKDVDLVCQIDVLVTRSGGGVDRKVSKEFRIGVCDVLRDTPLT